MMVNLLDEVSDTLFSDYTYCIIGTGIAGYEVARSLSVSSSSSILMLESGGVNPDYRYQQLNRQIETGKKTRIRHLSKHNMIRGSSRVRQLGGTLNIWSGRWKAMEEYDFTHRSWNDHLNWPVAYAEIAPYYKKIIRDYQLSISNDTPGATGSASGNFKMTDYYQQYPPVRLPGLLDGLSKLPHVTIVYHATVSHFDVSGTGQVTGVTVVTLSGKRYFIKARFYILATGGIENSRILLNTPGIAENFPVLGRFYMDHPKGELASVIPPDNLLTALLPCGNEHSRKKGLSLGLSDNILHRFQLPNHSVMLSGNHHNPGMPQNAARNAFSLLKKYGKWILPYRFHPSNQTGLMFHLEQLPSCSSYVSLSAEKDSLGIPKAILNWTFTVNEQEKLIRYMSVLKDEIKKSYGCELIYDDENISIENMGDASHHMGTTRMGTRRDNSVVNADCQVHGISNLFVTGSSIFCAAGNANPTLTITAFAARLAGYLARR